MLLWRCGMFDIQRLAFSFTETICMWALMVGNLPFFRKLPWPRSRHLTPQRILAYIGLEFNFWYIKSNHNWNFSNIIPVPVFSKITFPVMAPSPNTSKIINRPWHFVSMTPSTVDPAREESVFFVALVGGEPYQSRNKSVQKRSKITYPPKIYHPLPTSQKYYPSPPYKKYRLKGRNGIF